MARSIFPLSRALGLLCFFLTAFLIVSSTLALAQNSGTTQIAGVVLDVQRHPVADAQVRLSGAVAATTSTMGDGSFAFRDLPVGIYRLDVSKGGFDAATQEDIVTAAGGKTDISFTLQSASLTSLTVIGHVSVTTRNGANAINTTPASIVDVPATTFTDQGQLSVNHVLNEEPGITVGPSAQIFSGLPIANNGASPLQDGIPSVRGGLPYETESLIDGHPISLGQLGTFSPTFISPYLLQNVEVVKGPGATSPSINYAINGTVNYRTLEPTVKPQVSADFGMDQYGGNIASIRATGTLPGGRLSYAFGYVTQGTQGFNRGYGGLTWGTCGDLFLNGRPVNIFAGGSYTPNPSTNILGDAIVTTSTLLCCPKIPMSSDQRNELGKLRYAFTPSTTLTVTWLGAQSMGNTEGAFLFPCNNTFFTPPPGYTGALAPGKVLEFWGGNEFPFRIYDTNLFETEFHTPLGKTATLLVRQYASSVDTFNGGPGDSGPTAAGPISQTGAVYGGVYFGTDTTPTIFNGQVATLVNSGFYCETRTYDKLNGYTAEIDDQVGNSLLTLSYDQERNTTYARRIWTPIALDRISFPSGSSQTFQSVMGRVQFELGPRLNGTISDNFGRYTDVFSQDGGVTFLSATHTYQAPRLSFTWRPSANQSVRASVGTSIAPPYLALLNNIPGVGSNFPVTFYTEQENSGDVLPETSFGFDVGFDTRIHSPFTVLSVDAYQTVLRNQFLITTQPNGTYTDPNIGDASYGITAPLFITKTANLGHSKYEGIEVSLHRTPPTGWGYRIQGSLMRAFAYDLPAGFYDTPAGPKTTNLAIWPNINFQASGIGYNGMTSARVPYSTGYAEINHRGNNGSSFLVGMTYYGPNNAYNEPAFEVVTLSFDQPLTRHTSLQLSVYNLTNAYPNFYPDDFNAPILTPLVNGQRGPITANVVGPALARLTLHVDM